MNRPDPAAALPATVDLLTRRPDLHHIGAVGTVLWGWVSA